ncbi:YadA-like family protein [Sneathia sp. DSM 16631]|uniref:YadA-like family protein n=1 Tax=Sneathia sp. DSM 16631 TaxID=2777994 RepID=UPI00186737B0|nr:YadA-like family protein [Sneathia sp. DSM 16631]MBE3030823.1 YadA-like family protein [Sneathia sp. DSM 16631]
MKKSGKKKINLILIISSILLVCTSVGYADVTEDEIEEIKNKVKTELKSEIKQYLENIEIGKFKRTKDSGTYPGVKIEIKEDGEKGGGAKFSVGYLDFDGKNQIISSRVVDSERFVRGAFVRTMLDLYNHKFSLGALQFDGLHGNIYTANEDTAQYLAMFNNNVYKGKKWRELSSNIALGWGNSAGMQLKPIKKKIFDGMDDNELIIGYEQERGNPGIKEKNKPYAKNYDLYHNYYSLKKGFGEPNNNYSTAIGVRNASYGQGAFAIGIESVAGNKGTFAGGENAISSGINSISYGNNTLSAGKESMSFGYYVKAYGNRSFASGYESEAYGNNAIAMGSWSYAKAKNSLALSGGTVEPSATEGVAIGKGAVTKIEEGFSIGSEALADREKGKYGYNVIENKEYTNKDLGLDENVKYADYIEKIKDKKYEIKKNIYGIKKLEKENEKNEINIKGLNEFNETNVYEKTGKYEFNILQQIKETKDSLEKNLKNNKTKIERLKNERKTLDKALEELEDKIKGVTPYFSTVSAISIGNPDKGITRQLTGLSAGSEDTDAVNVAQLKAMRSYVDKKVTLKAGKSAYDIWATSSKAVEYVDKHNKKLKDLTELDFIDSLKGEQGIKGDGESAYQSWLKQDGNAGKSEGDFVKWLKGDKGDKGQDGKNGKDGQDGKSAFEVWKEKKNKPNAKEEDFFKDITKGAGLLAKEKEEMNKKIEDANKKSDLALGGVSNAVAMANLPQVMGDKKFNLAASYGYYGGSHAVAVGFSGTNDNQNFIYKLSGSVNSKGNLAFGIGAGVMMGSVNSKDKKIEELTKQNNIFAENIRKQNERIQKLEDIVKRLMNK